MKQIRIALIGSRALDELQYQEDAQMFYDVAYNCARLGIIMRSGAAIGADNIAEQAYAQAIVDGVAQPYQVEIFIPWRNFAPYAPLKQLHVIPTDPAKIKQANDMVWATHPAAFRLSQGAMKLHSRNMNQVFGLDLETPIDACICWTKNGECIGGTASAIKLCWSNDIPVFNLGANTNIVLEELDEFIGDHIP